LSVDSSHCLLLPSIPSFGPKVSLHLKSKEKEELLQLMMMMSVCFVASDVTVTFELQEVREVQNAIGYCC
jgi:hypothetical protein